MDRLTELRREMNSRGIFAYIVPTDDFHGSEYVGAHFRLREYLSGFTGSAGTLVVMPDEAALWTDGRYFIQAQGELHSGISLMKSGVRGVPKIEEFLLEKMPENSVLGFDGRVVKASFAKKLANVLSAKKITLHTCDDLAGMVVRDRPPLSKEPVFALPESVCGRSRRDKIADIRRKLSEKNADHLVVSALDEIAWTLGLRGGDVEYNPVFLAFMIVERQGVKIFAERSVFSEKIIYELKSDGVEIFPYDEIYSALASLSGRVWIDTNSVSFSLRNSLPDTCAVISERSPIVLMKSIKNESETAAEKRAHLKDGLAVTRFMMWLESAVGREKITEISAAEKLEEFRKAGEGYLGQSFAPIMAFGEHGAVVHYSADASTNAELAPRGFLLSDTGGHYLDGTTDITRTFVLGELSDEEKRAYTLVLAGHLELLHAEFPAGVRGSTLDYAAREPLWKAHLDFDHGTGHGVGFLLNVHEGPQRISRNAVNDEPLRAGMITSDEPGLYLEGKFGVRHESLLLCEKSDSSEFGEFLRFSPLTLVPFDPRGLEISLLQPRQIRYFNEYQQLVFEKLSPHLTSEETVWLREKTRPVKLRETE